MYAHADKKQENKSPSKTNPVSQMQRGSKPGVQLVNNRPEAAAQTRLQHLADKSSQVQQSKAFQKMADNRPQAEKSAQSTAHSGQSKHPVQRKISVGKDDETKQYTVDEVLKEIFSRNLIKDVREADAIEEILNVYDEKDMAFDDIDRLLEAARAELKKEDETIEHHGLPDMQSKKKEAALKNTQGAQLGVQAKMVEITHLLRAELVQGEDEEAEITTQYSIEVIDNGLCGGWVELFMQYPDWVEPVYNAVRTWTRPSGISDIEALQDFETHLNKVTKFKGANHVVKVLREVYDAMSRLEPKAGYDSLPEWTDLPVEQQPTSPTSSENVQTEEFNFKLKHRNAAKLVCSKVEQLTQNDNAGECMAHIESDLHHMALRVEKKLRHGKTKKWGLVITVVESEKKGMVKVDSWSKAEHVLNGWLAEEEPQLEKITLRIRSTGF